MSFNFFTRNTIIHLRILKTRNFLKRINSKAISILYRSTVDANGRFVSLLSSFERNTQSQRFHGSKRGREGGRKGRKRARRSAFAIRVIRSKPNCPRQIFARAPFFSPFFPTRLIKYTNYRCNRGAVCITENRCSPVWTNERGGKGGREEFEQRGRNANAMQKS